jgi:uncharacterized protein with GYD domain
MAIFITQGKYTHQALKGMLAKPEDRATQVKALAKRHGAKVLSYYVTFGEFDFLTIFEAPDANTAFAILATAGAGGSVSDLRTVPALTTAEAMAGFEAAGKSAKQFRSAGT